MSEWKIRAALRRKYQRGRHRRSYHAQDAPSHFRPQHRHPVQLVTAFCSAAAFPARGVRPWLKCHPQPRRRATPRLH